MSQKKSKIRELSSTDRAVYALVDAGQVDAAHAPLYRRSLGALARAGLVIRGEDGAYRAVPPTVPPPARVGTIAPPAPPQAPPAHKRTPPMGTLVVRVPEDVLATLDAEAERAHGTRSDIARAVLLGERELKAG